MRSSTSCRMRWSCWPATAPTRTNVTRTRTCSSCTLTAQLRKPSRGWVEVPTGGEAREPPHRQWGGRSGEIPEPTVRVRMGARTQGGRHASAAVVVPARGPAGPGDDMTTATDTERMMRAVELGARVRAETPPNPWVGCVLETADGSVFEGATQPVGGPHAEAVALAAALAAGADT